MERLNTSYNNILRESAFCISRKNSNSSNKTNSYKLGIIFVCISFLSFFLGSAASKALGTENFPEFTKIANDYVSYEVKCKTVLDFLSIFIKLISFDIKCLLLIFTFAFFAFPALALSGIIIYRGASLGLIVGTAFSADIFSKSFPMYVLLFTVPQLFSFVSLILCGFSACCFNDELLKFRFKFPALIKTGIVKKYIFSFLVSLGIVAVSTGIRMLLYYIN